MSRRSATTVKVFVGSLPPGTTVDELRQLFAPYGEIAECDVVNRCGFLHLEDKSLAFKAIDELNNTTFKGTRISVEKGRMKPPNRDRGGPMGRGGPRNGFGGPMRGGRDNYRGSPYMRDGGDYDRPPRGGPPRGGFGGGYDRGFGGRPGPMNSRPGQMNDGYSNGGDRRPYMDDRSGGYGGYGDSGYGMNSGGGDNMYNDYNMGYSGDRGGAMNRGGAPFERRPMMDERKPMMGDRRSGGGPMMGDRRPLLDNQGGPNMGGGSAPVPPPNMSGYDRRPQGDMFSRRDAPAKLMSGNYGDPTRGQTYDTSYPPIQRSSFAGGPGPRRDMPPVRRF